MTRPFDNELIDGLLWYAECRRFALEQITSFRPPADLRWMRLSHGLYLQHLHALLDLATEVDAELPQRWQAELGSDGCSGANNATYLRELRNMFVHRASDPTGRGMIVDGFVCVLAPEQVWGQQRRSGNRTGPFEAFDPLLWNMFAQVEEALPCALQPLVERAEDHMLRFDVVEAKEQYVGAIVSDARMTGQIADLALGAADQIPFDEINAHMFGRVRQLLGTAVSMPRLPMD